MSKKPTTKTFIEQMGKPEGVADAELETPAPRDLPRAADFEDKDPRRSFPANDMPDDIKALLIEALDAPISAEEREGLDAPDVGRESQITAARKIMRKHRKALRALGRS